MNRRALHKRWMAAQAVHAAIIAKIAVLIAAVEVVLGHVQACAIKAALVQANKIKKTKGREKNGVYI